MQSPRRLELSYQLQAGGGEWGRFTPATPLVQGLVPLPVRLWWMAEGTQPGMGTGASLDLKSQVLFAADAMVTCPRCPGLSSQLLSGNCLALAAKPGLDGFEASSYLFFCSHPLLGLSDLLASSYVKDI